MTTPETGGTERDRIRQQIADALHADAEQRGGLCPDTAPDAVMAVVDAVLMRHRLDRESDNLRLRYARARREALLEKLQRIEAEVAEEDKFQADDPCWEISVRVPAAAGDLIHEQIFYAVADAAHQAQPEDRNGWDIHASSTMGRADVPTWRIRRILDGD